ncbi:delta-like protein 4 [Cyprinodon tularosa]|uniref:delta-like protein 4 n=1 Tax=Cyprinodon tularosa TaxID=77115 RepID=UPI0018E20D9E|nr:delta-like protein 4 [Cyprinodon tularosa]
MADWFTSVIAIVMMLFTQVLGSSVFEIDLHHFQNTKALLANGRSCSSEGCRTYFRVCLKNFQREVSPSGRCIFGSARTPVLGTDSFSIQQDAPVRLPLNFTWPGAFSMTVEAWYSPAAEQPGDSSNPEFLISSFAIQSQLAIGPEWSQDVQTGMGTQTELRYSYRIVCKENYYGATCSKICTPRDDHFGHFTCTTDGDISCLPGWKGEYCQEAICLEGCNESTGICKTPGECICKDGWQGRFCDECKLHRFCKHGTCEKPNQCTCKEGWGGIFCDQDLHYCTNHKPCANGATCMNTGEGHYTCACLPGFAGKNCDLEVRECDSKPCHNGGRCEDSDTGYTCICPNGFEGPSCEHQIPTCADRPCFHGGKCKERDNGRSYICECPPGYTGLNCEKKVDKCTMLQCANGGHCVVQGNLRVCRCRSGFSGLRCEINIDECDRNPCANGSTCIDRINDYTCICPPGYFGRHCDRPTNRCASLPCLNGGTCIYGATGKPTCICAAPYSGPQCQDSDKHQANTPSLNLAAVGLGVGLVTVLVFLCIAVVVVRNRKKQKEKGPESKRNNLSRTNFQKENLISSVELKNNNKTVGLEVDCPTEKFNYKYINSFPLDYKSSMRYKDELSLLGKDENCEKTLEENKNLSRMYSERPNCRISTISSSKESVYQSVFVIGEEKQECIIATEV